MKRKKLFYQKCFPHFLFSSKINDLISVEITSSKPLSSVNYLLSARGKLILSAQKDTPNKNSFTITFTATFDMVPRAKLVVYYLVSTGDIVSTNIEIPVTGLSNFVGRTHFLIPTNFTTFVFIGQTTNVCCRKTTWRKG